MVEKALGARNILLKSDSNLVIGQIKGEYEVKEDRMQKYLRLTNHLSQEFDRVDFTQVPKNQNSEVDEVARQALSEEGTMFEIPRTIISNNGHQFDSQDFRNFCSGLGIKNQFSSLGHPQANRQTEVTNQTLLKINKVRLEEAKGTWPEELPNVLWAYRTTARTPIGETPFRLTYGTEAVILVEVGVTSMKREVFQENSNEDQLKVNLDYLDEVREEASQKMAKY
ncbi:uncharacterized protein LOC126721916 [Quercus robur]|uniref:uncharacterized protein LOC126721916 n=1 Tax=Quercus robur TaxID=38942 RepID=UPI0021625267|nr:uncharacterized protein LOC126721916 [Quercus robur]